MANDVTLCFVHEHREDDVRELALRARRDDDVNLPWALDQISGWQMARQKLPSWAAIDGIVYPPHLSMEQCSSQQTALYKCAVIDSIGMPTRKLLVDLTGGFGVDFAFMSRGFELPCYVESQEGLCEIARHNLNLLGLERARVVNADARDFLREFSATASPEATLIFIDPARRDDNSNRTYAIADCSPNVLDMMNRLFAVADHVLLKLSPMLDWHKAVADLGDHVAQVHIVSVEGECKELLILMDAGFFGEPTVHCVNDDQYLDFTPSQDVPPSISTDDSTTHAYLYQPNASIMKAGCYGVLTQRFPVYALAPDSHLFVSDVAIDDFPGRRFAVDVVTTMNKKESARALNGIERANVAVRNFPMSAQQLRSRLHLQDGGDTYIFGTTSAAGQHLIYICHKL